MIQYVVGIRVKNVLPITYASPDLDKRVLGDVVDLFSNMSMEETEGNQDVLGNGGIVMKKNQCQSV